MFLVKEEVIQVHTVHSSLLSEWLRVGCKNSWNLIREDNMIENFELGYWFLDREFNNVMVL